MKLAMGTDGKKRLAAALAVAGAVVVAFGGSAPAADTPPPAPGTEPPPSSPAAGSSRPAPAEDKPPPAPGAQAAQSIGDWIPPEGSSEKPKPEAWEKATPLALLRPNARCTASAIREWLRVACLDPDDHFKGVRVIGGSEKDVSIEDFKVKTAEKKRVNGVAVVLPVRRGDRRLLDVVRWEPAGWKMFYIREDTAITISELWLPGEAGPAIVLH